MCYKDDEKARLNFEVDKLLFRADELERNVKEMRDNAKEVKKLLISKNEDKSDRRELLCETCEFSEDI